MSEDSNDEEVADEDHDSVIPSIIDELQQDIVDRERGVFTQSDREFLLGMKQYEYDQSAINKRRDIRNRLYNGLLDLQLLERVPSSEREKLFSQIERGQLHESVAVLISFIYGGLGGNLEAIEQMVKSGIFKAERGGVEGYQGGARDVDVDIDLTQEFDVEEIYQRFMQGVREDLTPAEIGVLVREGRLDPEDYESLAWSDEERPRNTPASTEQWYHDEPE